MLWMRISTIHVHRFVFDVGCSLVSLQMIIEHVIVDDCQLQVCCSKLMVIHFSWPHTPLEFPRQRDSEDEFLCDGQEYVCPFFFRRTTYEAESKHARRLGVTDTSYEWRH